MKKKKITPKKRTKGVLLVSCVLICVLLVVSFLGESHSSKNETVPSQYLIRTSPSSQPSEDLLPSSSAQKQSSETPQQVLPQFLKAYFTQELDSQSLDTRESQLKGELTESTFQSLEIDTTTAQLKSMLELYQKKQPIDTNSSVRFVSRSLQSSTIYQEMSDSSQYYVEVAYSESSPETTGSFSFRQSLKLSLSNGQIEAVTLLATMPNGGNS